MEQSGQRVLVVVISASIAILLIVIAGMYLFLPQAEEPEMVQKQNQNQVFDPIEYLKNDNSANQTTTPLVSAVPPVTPATGTTSGTLSLKDALQNPSLTLPETPLPAAHRPQSTMKPNTKSSTKPHSGLQPAIATTTAPKPAPNTKPSGVAGSNTPPASVSPSTPQYWIQLFSSNKLESTQRAQLELSQHQIEGVISNTVVNGETYYRLRVGPFLTSKEANKFAQWFKTNQQFSQSYLVHVASR